ALSARAERDLHAMGVVVLKGEAVTEIVDGSLKIGERTIPTATIIWAAGNRASPLNEALNVPLDRQGRVVVQPDLTIPGDEAVSVIGDAGAVEGVPSVAPAAIQQGKYVARRLKAKKKGKTPPPFRYFDKGSLATIGKNRAVGYVGKITLRGWIAWAMWAGIHLAYLATYQRRLFVMIAWVVNYFGSGRRARVMLYPLSRCRRIFKGSDKIEGG
ncbi:MAG: FAD-dependent oxidoreductase, partial [Chlamydiota bacterium]|nr:FAD-dependent oxidoreductase [Chlamydiota bacterium]